MRGRSRGVIETRGARESIHHSQRRPAMMRPSIGGKWGAREEEVVMRNAIEEVLVFWTRYDLSYSTRAKSRFLLSGYGRGY